MRDRVICRALSLTALLVFVFSTLLFMGERKAREPVERFIKEFEFDVRRPFEAETAGLTPSPDFARQVVADTTVRDALGTINLKDLTTAERAAWFRAVPRTDRQLAEAANLMLDAIAARPGWPYHPFLVGQLVYIRGSRSLDPAVVRNARTWMVPLVRAAHAGPGEDAFPKFLAGAFLELWPYLPREQTVKAGPLLRRAFLNESFVERGFAPAISFLGKEAAGSLLPDQPGPLRAAFDIARKGDDLDLSAALALRLRSAEWNSRVRDLAELERVARSEDPNQLHRSCRLFAEKHSIFEFDDAKGQAQIARLLNLWPADVPGDWQTDRRSDLVRYFLAGRTAIVPGEILLRSLAALEGAPPVLLARAHVLAKNPEEAGRILSSLPAGSLEPTPALVELARFYLDARDLARARSSIRAVAPAAQQECDVLILRREIAARSGDEAEIKTIDREWVPLVRNFWTETGDMSLCVDPARSGGVLTVALEGASEALISSGWNGGTLGLSRVHEGSTLRIPVPSMPGRHQVSVRTLAGAGVRLSSGELEPRKRL